MMNQVSFLLIAFLSTFLHKAILGNSQGVSSATDCTIEVVFDEVELILSPLPTDLTSLSYEDANRVAKELSRLSFSQYCKVPKFAYAYENVSLLKYDKSAAAAVENGMLSTMAKVVQKFEVNGTLYYDALKTLGGQVENYAMNAFKLSFLYTPIQAIICTQLMALRILGTKLPDTNFTEAKALLDSSLTLCSGKMNKMELSLRELNTLGLMNPLDIQDFPAGCEVTYAMPDRFDHIYHCIDDPALSLCMHSCASANMKFNYLLNPVKRTYKKIFNSGYCTMRNKFLFTNDYQNIEAVDCLNHDYHFERVFDSKTWYVRKHSGELISDKYVEKNRTSEGILLDDGQDPIFINLFENVIRNTYSTLCNKDINLLPRCELEIPPFRGNCYPNQA